MDLREDPRRNRFTLRPALHSRSVKGWPNSAAGLVDAVYLHAIEPSSLLRTRNPPVVLLQKAVEAVLEEGGFGNRVQADGVEIEERVAAHVGVEVVKAVRAEDAFRVWPRIAPYGRSVPAMDVVVDPCPGGRTLPARVFPLPGQP
jgi:hypothetical protein